MKIILLLPPDIPEVQSGLAPCLRRYAHLTIIQASAVAAQGAPAEKADMLAERLSQPDCRKGYILSGFPSCIDEAKALDEALKNMAPKSRLPHVVYWSGKPSKAHAETMAQFRKQTADAANYYYARRRLIPVAKLKKMARGFKEVKRKSKRIRLLRWAGVSVLGILLLAFVLTMIFRDLLLKRVVVAKGQEMLGARLDIDELSTGLSPLSLRFHNLKAADADAPMKNLLEFSTAEASIDAGSLVNGKLHIPKLNLLDLKFNTDRETSGAFPGSSIVEAPMKPLPVAAEEADSPSAAWDMLQELKPPDPNDLLSTQALKKLKSDAENRHAILKQKIDALDVQSVVQISQKALDGLKTIHLDTSFEAGIRNTVTARQKEVQTLAASAGKDLAAVQKTLDELKQTAVKDVKDVAAARQILEKGKQALDAVKAAQGTLDQAKAVAGSGKDLAATAKQRIGEEMGKAKAEISTRMDRALLPLRKTREQATGLTAEIASAAKAIADGTRTLQAAAEQDIANLKQQYSPQGITASGDRLLRKLLGDVLVDFVSWGWVYYQKIKPYLPVSEKTEPVARKTKLPGTTYTFPASGPGDVMPLLMIDHAAFTGELMVDRNPVFYSGKVIDFATNLAYTGRPVKVFAEGGSKQDQRKMSLKLECHPGKIIKGNALISGLTMTARKIESKGKFAGLLPAMVHEADIAVEIRDLLIAEQRMDAVFEITISNLKLDPPSGRDVDKEITAIFSGLYERLTHIKIIYGIGAHRSLRTEPDLSKMLADGIRARISEKMAKLRGDAEGQIRTIGNDNLSKSGLLGNPLDALRDGALTARLGSLDKADQGMTKARDAEFTRLSLASSQSEKRVSGDVAGLASSRDSLNSTQTQIDLLTSQIETERKRIQDEIAGSAVKKIKLPKLPKLLKF